MRADEYFRNFRAISPQQTGICECVGCLKFNPETNNKMLNLKPKTPTKIHLADSYVINRIPWLAFDYKQRNQKERVASATPPYL